MVTFLFARLLMLTAGTLYPAYKSYKAVKSKDVKEYVRWMMYWIVFAVYIAAETITDTFFSWFPFYYYLKIGVIVWLVSPWTRGSSMLYRNWIHPWLINHERDIDSLLELWKSKVFYIFVAIYNRSIAVAREVVTTAAIRSSDINSPQRFD